MVALMGHTYTVYINAYSLHHPFLFKHVGEPTVAAKLATMYSKSKFAVHVAVQDNATKTVWFHSVGNRTRIQPSIP